MQSHTLIESQSKSNDPLNAPQLNGHPRMGPVPEFLRPLPVLSSSNSNTTLKYKKAAILNHNLSQGLDAKYNNVHGYGRYDRSKYEASENGYGKDLSSSDSDENTHFLNNKPGGNSKHFASMQGPYGIINNSMFLKKEETKETEEMRQGRSRFLSNDLLNNAVSDKMNSSHVNYSGQFQANFIGHIASQNYLNRHVPSSSEQAMYFNNSTVNGHSDRPADNREPSNPNRDLNSNHSLEHNNQSQSPRSSPHHRATPPEQHNQENASQDDQQTNKKFKVPSKVPKESLLKYRILHKNNQRNLTQVSTELPSGTVQQDQSGSRTTENSGTASRNGSPCDSNFSSSLNLTNAESSLPAVNIDVQFKRPVDGEHNSHNNQFKRPTDEPNSNNIQFKRPNDEPVSLQSNPVVETSTTVINSEIQPNHFSKGVLIKLENGLIKHLEDLQTEDFVSSAEKSTRHRLEPSTVMKVEEKPGGVSIVLTLCYGEKKHQVEYESMVEQPYYVINKGWSSFSPARTHNKYGLACKQLLVGDTCISLCQKSTTTGPSSPNKPSAAQAKAKRKELEKHFNLITSKDRELNERKKRRWSAPDQIQEKTNKKLTAKQIKLNEENDPEPSVSHVATSTFHANTNVSSTLPTSTIQNGADQKVIISYHQDVFPNTSYYQYSTPNSNVAFPSTVQSSQYLTSPHPSHPSSSSTTSLTHLITKPIVSHLPLSTSVVSDHSSFAISTLSSPSSNLYPSKPSYLIHASPSLPSPPSSNANFQYASISSSSNFINGPPISYTRNRYPLGNPVKYAPSGAATTSGKNNFSNVGTLAKSAKAGPNVAVDFSKYSSKK